MFFVVFFISSKKYKETNITITRVSKELSIQFDKMTCIQCGESSKYKCPTCREPYCSVACYKIHKQTPCSQPPDPPKQDEDLQESSVEYEYPTEDTVPVEKLKLLEKSLELRKCLDNPHVREILELLDKSPYPDELMQEYMQEPIFTEFVDECLKVVQPQDDN